VDIKVEEGLEVDIMDVMEEEDVVEEDNTTTSI
jgi:hypothetical protein